MSSVLCVCVCVHAPVCARVGMCVCPSLPASVFESFSSFLERAMDNEAM